ncbi:MAG: exosortase system-associated protein, TIGR04073 family [Saprospiraceae bacterium]|nr:exosortase system-associated protein, TIGR04073 family [Candidatus Brachybacter algidus]
MNKNKFLAACILFGALVTAPATYAAEEDVVEYFPKKVLQGFTNIATGFIELPKNIINITNEHNIFVGMTWGVLRGTAQAISRTFVGTAELLTSPFQTGELNSPAFVWERFSEDSRFFGKNYGGYWTTYGPLDDGND